MLGRSVAFPGGWVALARLSGAPVIPAFMVRRPRSARFHARLGPPIHESLIGSDDLGPAVEAYARQLEALVRRYPCHAVTLVLGRPRLGPIGESWDSAFRVPAARASGPDPAAPGDPA